MLLVAELVAFVLMAPRARSHLDGLELWEAVGLDDLLEFIVLGLGKPLLAGRLEQHLLELWEYRRPWPWSQSWLTQPLFWSHSSVSW